MSTRASLASFARRAAALAACAALLSACGGGSSTPHLQQSNSSSSGPKGTATLTLQFPANFHHAMTHGRTVGPAPASAKRTAASTRRSPQYINPTSGDVLHVYAQPQSGGTFEVTPNGGVAIVPNATDNSQVFSISVPAGTYSNITADEVDGSDNTLAGGTNYSPFTIDPGSTGNTIAVTMDMNPQAIVITTDIVSGGDATILSSSNDTSFCAFNSPQTIYVLASDSSAGFVLPSTSAGGPLDYDGNPTVPLPTLDGNPGTSDASTIAASTFPSAFNVKLQSPSSSYLSGVFFAHSQYFGNYAYGYFALGGAGSAACTPGGTFTPNPVTTGYSSALQITGGTAPYNVVNTDDNCEPIAQTDSPLTDQWTVQSEGPGVCNFTITDHNGTQTNIQLGVNGT